MSFEKYQFKIMLLRIPLAPMSILKWSKNFHDDIQNVEIYFNGFITARSEEVMYDIIMSKILE